MYVYIYICVQKHLPLDIKRLFEIIKINKFLSNDNNPLSGKISELFNRDKSCSNIKGMTVFNNCNCVNTHNHAIVA
jgi:hypothetical protein